MVSRPWHSMNLDLDNSAVLNSRQTSRVAPLLREQHAGAGIANGGDHFESM
jgi:hypothetical protein